MFEKIKEFHRNTEENKVSNEAKNKITCEQIAYTGKIPSDWLNNAFPNKPTASEKSGHKCGERQMLILVAYDISSPKRLAAVSKHCENYGIRVQYSVFECRMEADIFERFWEGLCKRINPDEDRAVAYRICLQCSKKIETAGQMVTSENVIAYVF